MRKRILNRSHIFVAILLLLMVKVLAEVTVRLSIFDPVQGAVNNFSILDIYYQIQAGKDKEMESPFITIVDISKLYDRGQIASAINDINTCKPAVVGLDVMFEGLRGDTLGSQFVADAIRGAESPVVAFKLGATDDNGNFTDATYSFFSPMEHVEEGYINLQAVEAGDAIREMGTWNILNGDTVFSLPYLMAHQFSSNVVYTNWPRRHLIDYTPTKFPIVSADSILDYQEQIKDHIVLLGGVDDLEDMHESPYGRISGSIIQAFAIQTLIEHHHIREVPMWLIVLITFLVLVFTSMAQQEISHRARHSRSILLRFLFQSDLIKNVMNFIWMAFLMWVNFMVFTQLDIYFNPTIMLVCIALLVEVRLFYDSGIEAYKQYQRAKQIKRATKETETNNITE